MKLFKSLLLGSAAGLVAVSGASAADLGVKKPTAAVEYVRVCSAHGAGFFYIPGSDVCMQISGRVRAEYMYGTSWNKADDQSSFRGHGRINLDVRQTTQYGLLRAYVRMEQYANNGRYFANYGTQGGITNANVGGAGNVPQGLATEAGILNKAFIQFYTGTAGFFTAGRSVSFFDFYANDANYGRIIGSDRDNVNLFAYTFTFGGGLTATLSLEDAYNRRIGLAQVIPTGATALGYAGQKMPDVVANVRIDQAWGSAQLSGALHQLNLINWTNPAPAAGADYVSRGTKYGWGIQGGLKINLPMLAAGDVLWVQAAYAKGAADYAGVTRFVADAAPFGIVRGTVPAGADAYDVAGSVKLSTSWSVLAAFVHNFTPTVQGAVYGSFGEFDAPTGSTGRDFRAYSVGGRLNWIPVRNFTIGAEVMYNVLDPKGTGAAVIGQTAKGKYDSVTARIRFQRDF
jgi:hypothetical protein